MPAADRNKTQTGSVILLLFYSAHLVMIAKEHTYGQERKEDNVYFMHYHPQLHSIPLNKAGNIYQVLQYFQGSVEPVSSYTKKEAMKDATFPLGLILVAAAVLALVQESI